MSVDPQTVAAVSAYILARNEEKNIAAAIKSLDFVDEIVVIDTGSTDQTISIAKHLGASVVELPFCGFGPSRNQALKHCQHDWIICLDADERISEELRTTLLAELTNPTHYVYLAPRQNIFLNRPIKYSGWYPDYRHPILFHRQHLAYSDDLVHETYITEDKVSYFTAAIIHYPYADIKTMLAKSNHYSSLGVNRLKQKNKHYHRFSPRIHASWAFFRQYILQRGILDGWPGFILAANSYYANFYRYLKYLESTNANTSPRL